MSKKLNQPKSESRRVIDSHEHGGNASSPASGNHYMSNPPSSSLNHLNPSYRDRPVQDVSSQSPENSVNDIDSYSPLQFPLINQKNLQGKKMESQFTTHTFRSHGVTLARTHMHDWLILMFLVVIEVILNVIHPFYRFVGKDMMADLKYPLKNSTVPLWSVPVYAVLLPIVIFLVIYLRRRCVYDLHHAVLGLLFSVLITGVITDSIKDAVGRPRPDFFWRCFPDGKDVYDNWGNVVCHGDLKVIREGHKSFPSGHTSWSFAGLGFLSLYLSGKIKVFDQKGHVAKVCLTLLPLLVASLVGVSRVDDYWHHWQDVFAGGLIGLVVAVICYLQFFPAPYHAEGFATYAYSRVLEESRGGAERMSVVNSSSVQIAEVQGGNNHNGRNHNPLSGSSLNGDSSSTLEDIESGRR